uniref:Uncharacterized protein n=1 Tax=Pseudo-nitzschia australis TaxID=44445 RepID=A0A7S4ANS8_9STRA|mmetsp:Transcript_1130/g.2293  ORF Transcript_1130/g.2293 Transcript_1130/m.2293 type:complete len:236 (-) Transcript_1130:485-1192(-)|eukprot:CAMPEP_0168167778 /NCGR_PEP_ID=MMETSP0139_2-20121125/2719_1 /TAXON_ID=44445 /ORGANISM="Pseudo-nitzschia australis, Strain 10249 10 AB" /LENGTH=235 /DNA_ID=CAMNT_0008085019 /DNA_START=136 /DNA_END=843 /DNA_ORIENTATION=-
MDAVDALFESFYNSFASSVSATGDNRKRVEPRQPLYEEIELVKVTAPRDDLNRFAEELSRIKHNIGINVEISIVIPSSQQHEHKHDDLRSHERRRRTNSNNSNNDNDNNTSHRNDCYDNDGYEKDFLDRIFSDTIPILHDFLTYGSPEAEFFQIKGPKGSLNLFNDMCATMVHAKDLRCKLEITDRRRIYGPKYLRKTLKNDIFGCPNSERDLLDAMFTDDFSRSMPALHGMLVA